MGEPLLKVDDLRVIFGSLDTGVRAVDGVSFEVHPGETLGIVGESGSGKSVTVMSMLGLIPSPPGNIAGGTAMFDGEDLLSMPRRRLRQIRGREIGMIFQDAMTALNPVLAIGFQITEALQTHDPDLSDKDATAKAVELLATVGVPNPEQRVKQYPHEYSGGMRQRAMIAMAMANNPRLLIADEPTTALDVTIQAQVLAVLNKAKADTHASTILITHDLGVIAEMADRVAVMYAGKIVETGTVHQVFEQPRHPYTIGLLTSLPRLDTRAERLLPIRGNPPNARQFPSGCRFHDRCDLMGDREICATDMPELIATGDQQFSRCHFTDEVPDYARRLREQMQVVGDRPADSEVADR
jgi:oligopeptide/dipeptide ABC transporter ATP-binding protein